MAQADLFAAPRETARRLAEILAESREKRSFNQDGSETIAGQERQGSFIRDAIDSFIDRARKTNTETADIFSDFTPPTLDELAAAAWTPQGRSFSIGTLADGTRFADITDVPQDIGSETDAAALRSKVEKLIRSRWMGKIIDPLRVNVFVNGNTAHEYANPAKRLGGDALDAKMQAATGLDEVVTASDSPRTVPDGKDGHKHENVRGWEHRDVIFRVAGRFWRGIVNIALVDKVRGIAGDFRRLHDITGIKEVTGEVQKLHGQPLAESQSSLSNTGDSTGESTTPPAAGQERRFSVGPVYTGTAADYANRSRQGGVDDGPSVKKIGTGEGTQVYGYGLYGSTVRGVGEGYAKNGRYLNATVTKDGEKVSPYSSDEIRDLILKAGSVEEAKRKVKAREYFFSYDKRLSDAGWEYRAKELEGHDWRMESPSGFLYEQTFFTNRAPGDESHLLNWYEPVSEEQLGWIESALKREGLDVNDFRRYMEVHEHGGEITGQSAYQAIGKIFESSTGYSGRDKAASEFLARAGIDGVKYPVNSYGKTVKDGDKAGWNYVAFSDEHIRVDHKWTDGGRIYSVSVTPKMRLETTVNPADMTRDKADAALRALAGRNLKNDETGIVAQVNSVQRRKILSNAAVRKSQDNGFSVKEHDAAASILETLWKVATLGKSDSDKNGDPALKSVKRFVAPVRLGNRSAYAYMTVKESGEHGHRVYSIELEKLEALAGMFKERTPRAANASDVPEGTPPNIPQSPAAGQERSYSVPPGAQWLPGLSPDEERNPGDATRHSATARARREYDEVVRRYTNPDGSRKPGWMKAPNGRPTNLTERQWVQVRTPAFKEWFGDWETAELQKWLEGEPVASATGHEYENVARNDLEDAVVEFFKNRGVSSVENADIGKVNITRSGIHDSIFKGIGRTKIAAFNYLPEIIANGRVVSNEQNWKERGYNSAVIAAPISIGEKAHVAFVVVRRHSNGDNNFYLHEVGLLDEIKKEAERLDDTGLSPNGAKVARPLGSLKSLAKNLFVDCRGEIKTGLVVVFKTGLFL